MDEKHLIETEISDETIYDGRIVKLHRKTVQLPNGSEAKREIVIHPGAVAVVPLFSDNRVALVRQFRLPAKQVLLEVPAGTLEPNENPDDAVIRELREETGFRPSKIEKIGGIFVAPGYTTEYIHLYMAQGLTKDELEKDADEFIDVTVIALSEALEKIFNGEIRDAKSVSSLMLVARRLGI
jgi:ADP-ribose pyrophosphatase